MSEDMEVFPPVTRGRWGRRSRDRQAAVIRAGAARRLGRQHDVARALNVTDKRVATWRTRRAVNGFPEPVACNIGPHTHGGKRHHLLWDIGECEAWFRRYSERDQRARRGPYQQGSRP